MTLTTSEGAERLRGETVTGDYFRVLGVAPALGSVVALWSSRVVTTAMRNGAPARSPARGNTMGPWNLGFHVIARTHGCAATAPPSTRAACWKNARRAVEQQSDIGATEERKFAAASDAERTRD